MLIIKIGALHFEHILPLIREQEAAGRKYLRDETDLYYSGPYPHHGKRVYFDDGTDVVTFENRTGEKT